MNNSIIVWDLETVPDLRGYAAANGMSASTDDEVREAIGDKFPKHIYHSIVCIGALVAQTADAIASRLGIAKDAMIRARAGISYALTEALNDGHCGLPVNELLRSPKSFSKCRRP
jgi:hypothetical protein